MFLRTKPGAAPHSAVQWVQIQTQHKDSRPIRKQESGLNKSGTLSPDDSPAHLFL